MLPQTALHLAYLPQAPGRMLHVPTPRGQEAHPLALACPLLSQRESRKSEEKDFLNDNSTLHEQCQCIP